MRHGCRGMDAPVKVCTVQYRTERTARNVQYRISRVAQFCTFMFASFAEKVTRGAEFYGQK